MARLCDTYISSIILLLFYRWNKYKLVTKNNKEQSDQIKNLQRFFIKKITEPQGLNLTRQKEAVDDEYKKLGHGIALELAVGVIRGSPLGKSANHHPCPKLSVRPPTT